ATKLWLPLNSPSPRFPPFAYLGLQWETGLRMAYITVPPRDTVPAYTPYFGDPGQSSVGPLVFTAQVTNMRETLVAFGPHVGVAPSWAFGDTGLALGSRLDVGVLVGAGSAEVTASEWGGSYRTV